MIKWIGLLLVGAPLIQGAELLTVHEWGTFTCLQDAAGEAIPGINTDEETLPDFVHEMMPGLIVGPKGQTLVRSKASFVPQAHPSVTMRLETPVVYFYLPPGVKKQVLDLEVKFKGGWLSQFYPDAVWEAPGAVNTSALSTGSSSSLLWKGLKIGGKESGIPTESPIWLAPRVDRADSVENESGEIERYVFYRGLGQLDSPLRLRQEKGELIKQWEPSGIKESSRGLPMWLLDVRPGGSMAFRELGEHSSIKFKTVDYQTSNLSKLRTQMESALVQQGLYSEEARAMLKTWEISYFRSPGLRVFYLVPPEWVDKQLPLKVSLPARINRVMIGRIELMTEDHEKNLKQLSSLRIGHSFAGKEMPKAYMELGRFRQAMVRYYQKKYPTAELAGFIALNGL